MIILGKDIVFPAIETASPEGIMAIGGDLSKERLIRAYQMGIFPWYNEGEPIIWYSPDPRMVLFPEKIKISKSMRTILKKEEYVITFNKSFEEVIQACKSVNRKDQKGTWITDKMLKAYVELYKIGIAKSVEVWKNKTLVGGLYGVDLDPIFCGESMFSKESNTSKLALIYLANKCKKENYKVIDCQVYNRHLESLGAEEISRNAFKKILNSKTI